MFLTLNRNDMQEKRVKCTNCGVILDVRNSKGEAVKIITCPKCKSQLKVNFPPEAVQEPLEAKTVLVNTPSGESPTVLGGAGLSQSGDTQYVPKPNIQKQYYLFLNGKRYPLSAGRNVVGRKASSSDAQVQIETSDLYMSRRHICIEVIRLTDGSTKVFVSNDKNKNSTYVNGSKLNTGDRVVLTNGTQIKMGETIVTYQEES